MIAAAITAEERFAIDDLYAAYAAVLDERRFDEWPDFFTEDGRYTLIPRENYERGLPLATLAFESRGMLRDRVYGITQTLFHEPYVMRHAITNLRVQRVDDGYAVEANYLVVRTKSGNLTEILSAGRYRDRIARIADALMFVEKIVVFDSELIPNSIIYPI